MIWPGYRMGGWVTVVNPTYLLLFYPDRFRLRQSRYKSPLGVYWCPVKSRDEDSLKRILGKVVE